jgi:hypothetical protein
MDYEIPSYSQWKEIVQPGKKKCNIPETRKWSPSVTKFADLTKDQSETDGAEETEQSEKLSIILKCFLLIIVNRFVYRNCQLKLFWKLKRFSFNHFDKIV